MALENDDIVISGMAGRFPECENVDEFKEALLNGIDMVTDNHPRFPPGLWGIPERSGKVKDIESFDAGFFRVSPKQADNTDPRQRILLETTFEAIIDAGINPQELKGTNTGVYVGITGFDSFDRVRENKTDGYSNIGYANSICANRISYTFNFKGPSCSLDSACSSSIYALASAVNALLAGDIENAIVAGTSINLHPFVYLEFLKLNVLSSDGKCKAFSSNRDGYARSDAVVTILLQRRKKARRAYASVMGVRTNSDGFKIEGITNPSAQMQLELMKEMYAKLNIDPNEIFYIEAHAGGTPVGDIKECQAIAEMFCKNRKEPLLVGSLKTNMGHSECASGLCSLIKILIAMETGIIPSNLHVSDLDNKLPGICDGKLKVVAKNEPWNGGIAALNSFGIGGANAHALIKCNSYKKSNNNGTRKHRLIQVSGRTEESVNYYLDKIKLYQNNNDFFALIDQIHKINIEGHIYRGYEILGQNAKVEIKRCCKEKRPIWFVYTGMGSQWPGMCRDLMKIDIFRNTFLRCAEVLKQYNIDLEYIAVNGNADILEDVVNSFCAIVATEVALTDVLTALNIIPDGLIGHSLGEIGCGYADGGLEPEQAVLLAYARGYASLKAKLPNGQMAAVGLGPAECQKHLPNDVVIACYNGSNNVTIAGPEDSVLDTVTRLSNEGIFTRLVNTGHFAYHSQYISAAGSILLDFARKVICKPNIRSAKWLSSSVLETEWNSEAAKYNSPEYHYNNFMQPVRFDQLFKHVPENAIVIEIAPHGLLQAILKREFGPGVTNIPLINRAMSDNEHFFLMNIGKIFINGGQPNLSGIYNDVTFPVCKGTPSISSLIKWDHGVKWFVPYFQVKDYYGETVCVNISDEEHSYLGGHVIDGKILMPAAGYMVMAWSTLAKMYTTSLEMFPVVMKNIKFKRATILRYNETVKFIVNIMKQSGYFEIYESGSVVASGTISTPKDISREFVSPKKPQNSSDDYLPLRTDDVYKEFNLRRYMHDGLFKAVLSCNVSGTQSVLKWNENWVCFLDAVLQSAILNKPSRNLVLVTEILKLVIDPKKHMADIEVHKNEIPAFINSILNVVKAGGIEIIGEECSRAPRRQHIQAEPSLETYDFVPYEYHNEQPNLYNSLTIAMQIVIENNNDNKYLKICEAVASEVKLSPLITEIMNREPMTKFEICTIKSTEKMEDSYDLIALDEDVVLEFNVDFLIMNLKEGGFLLYRGTAHSIANFSLEVIYRNSNTEGIYLLRQATQIKLHPIIRVSNSDLSWIDEAKQALKNKSIETVYLLAEGEDGNGIVGLIKSLVLEPGGTIFKAIYVYDKNAEKFSFDLESYRKQLKKNLVTNVLKNGTWGSYRHLPLKCLEVKEVSHAYCNILTPGDLSSLRWLESSPKYYTSSSESEECYIYYSALNFRDVLEALGKVQPHIIKNSITRDFCFGLEYSGITKNSKRIMGIVEGMSLGLQVRTHPSFTWEVPIHWSLEEAVTVPFVYAMSYFALIARGQLKIGESILIHAGDGDVGLAAISIALGLNCVVFTTVDSEEKMEYIEKMFPRLKHENIGNCRNHSFEQMILENTKGRGVNVVLNSLSGDLFQASLRCVSASGRFLEIGKADFLNDSPIFAKFFNRNRTFHGIHFHELLSEELSVKLTIKQLVSDGISSGIVRPLPRIVFKEDEIENAFRYLAAGKNKGKVLIEIRNETKYTEKSLSRTIKAIPRIYMSHEKVYILIGGLGGLGLELANWLIGRGATKIILNSRRNVTNGYQTFCLKKWKDISVTVVVNLADTTTIDGAKSLAELAKGLGPVGGVFNLALVLKDAILKNQTVETFQEVFKPKIISGQNMDFVTRKYCPQLDHFVVFSSLVSGRGNAGQCNYGMANSAFEQICEKRKNEGLPGLAIQWGPIGDIGYLVNFERKNTFYCLSQNLESCLYALERFMLQSHSVGASFILDDRCMDVSIASVKTPAETIAHILGISNIEHVDSSAILSELGLDSLMAEEIKRILYRKYNIHLEIDYIRNLTFNALQKLMISNSQQIMKPRNEYIDQGATAVKKVVPSPEGVMKLKSVKNDKLIFFLPPIEGHSEIFQPMTEKLNSTVYGLQYTESTNHNKISKSSPFFVDKIKAIQKEGPYLLCAYAYGCIMAFDVALLLETEGYSVTLVFIDGSPTYINYAITEFFLKSEAQEDPLNRKFQYLFGNMYNKVSKILDQNWDGDSKFRDMGGILFSLTEHEVDKLSDDAKWFYQRLYAGYYYNPSKMLKGKVMLIRCSDYGRYMGEDFGLAKVCEQKVDIHELQGDHQSVIQGDNVSKIAEIINKFLLQT